jgi:hypothetical protein
MAIGDSLYQGVRSMSIAADRARYSPPALIAKALGKTMSLPLMPRPILFDLEEILRQGGVFHLFTIIQKAVLDNVDAWLADPMWSTEEAFDNLSLGQAGIDNLAGDLADSFDVYWPQIPALRAAVAKRGSDQELVTNIGKLWYALNACFVLNPSRKSSTAQSKASPLEQVAARKPDVLLVNIGSNEGLFRAGFTGHYDDKAQASIANIPNKMEALAKLMQSTLPENTKIIVNSILKPRFIPNLMPRHDPDYYPGAEYFSEYVARIGDGTTSLTAKQLRCFDEQVFDVNSDTKRRMETILGDRLTFVDLYSTCDRIDGKHYEDRSVLIPKHGYSFRNIPLAVLLGHFQRGGIVGLDNMHPTVVGYALVAQEVLRAMGSTASLSIDEAYREDTLLNNLVGPLFSFEIALLGSLGLFKDSELGDG